MPPPKLTGQRLTTGVERSQGHLSEAGAKHSGEKNVQPPRGSGRSQRQNGVPVGTTFPTTAGSAASHVRLLWEGTEGRAERQAFPSVPGALLRQEDGGVRDSVHWGRHSNCGEGEAWTRSYSHMCSWLGGPGLQMGN